MSHDPETPQSPTAPSTSLALGICSVVDAQDALDWKRFSKLFYDQEGYYPHLDRCQHARSAWLWFSKGAHEEFAGRLSSPNSVEVSNPAPQKTQ